MFVDLSMDFIQELLKARNVNEFYTKLVSALGLSTGANVVVLSSNSKFIRWSKLDSDLKDENEELLAKLSKYLICLLYTSPSPRD